MSRRSFLLGLGFALLATGETSAADAQGTRESAVAALVRCQEALGGTARLAAIRDITRVLALSRGPEDVALTQEVRLLPPNAIRQTSILGPNEIVAFSDGTRGWVKSPWGLDLTLPEWQLRAARQDVARQLEILVLADRDPTIRLDLVGADEVDGIPAAILRIFADQDRDLKLWQDAASGLPLKLEYRRIGPRGYGETVEDRFEDYRDVDGLRVPFLITTRTNGEAYMQAKVLRLTYNSGLQPEELSRPPQ
jgi:hypothetical protein